MSYNEYDIFGMKKSYNYEPFNKQESIKLEPIKFEPIKPIYNDFLETERIRREAERIRRETDDDYGLMFIAPKPPPLF